MAGARAAARLLSRWDGHATALRNAGAAVHADALRAAERAAAQRELAALHLPRQDARQDARDDARHDARHDALRG
ncbi:hypothetical protein D5H78_06750 [Vallicoccus soli]|uniref:Uncharacterized protein n=1 Tax=Vallicoccus soli TaxID=2339232 RepID=A0A3A3YYY2_9ACTN|nr:hypothetical protein D5H78_06750 [Vallicoccus soli]